MSDLKPCPFCEGTPSLSKILRDGCKDGEPDAWAHWVSCVSCAGDGPWAKSESGAIRLWNTRPIEDKLTGELAAARAEIERLTGELGSAHGEIEWLKEDNRLLHEANEKTWCAYCNKEYQRADSTMEQIHEHIATCELHPMRKLEAEIVQLQDENNHLRAMLCEAVVSSRGSAERILNPPPSPASAPETAQDSAERQTDRPQKGLDDRGVGQT